MICRWNDKVLLSYSFGDVFIQYFTYPWLAYLPLVGFYDTEGPI